MATETSKRVEDGFSVLTGGMDAGIDPRLIRPDQCALAVNTTFRGGFAQTRPSFTQRPIKFKTEEEQDWFEQGIFQGADNYSYNNRLAGATSGPEVIVVSVSGRVWVIDICTWEATEITPGGLAGRNTKCSNMAYFVQAGKWLIVQDGIGKPILWDGSLSRRAKSNEVPTGTVMAYGNGRLFVSVGTRILAGDLLTSNPDTVIQFTERLILATNGDLNPGFIIGEVTAMAFIAQQDTATGVGPLIVWGLNGATSIFAELQRSEWFKGIQRIVLPNIGNSGHRHVAQINGDVWFRSTKGIRSYRQARAEISIWGQLPFSTEISEIIDQDSDFLLKYGSSVFFNNRLLVTCSPRVCNGRVWHGGMMVLDFDVLSGSGKASKPAWDGFWTGINVSQLVTTQEQCFGFALDNLGRNYLTELEASEGMTSSGDTIGLSTTDTACRIIGGTYAFDKAGGPTSVKLFGDGAVWMKGIQGRVSLNVFFRKDDETCWQNWASNSFCAPMTSCEADIASPDPCFLASYNPQYRNRISLPKMEVATIIDDDLPPDHSGNEGFSLTSGYQLQPKIEWTGRAKLSIVALSATPGTKREAPGCSPPDKCIGAKVCCDPIFDATPEQPYYIAL